MRYGNTQLEIKALGDTGSFSGYASIFGNVDFGGDVIERGAFKEIVTTKDNQVRMLFQHDTRNPIGKASVIEDTKGLYFEGSLVLADPMARKSYEMIKAGVMDGMSIGYDVLENGAEIKDNGVRYLTRLKLWEISPVVFGMNELARIESVKRAVAQITSQRDYEDALRDILGFSRSKAKVLSNAWKELPGQRDAADGADGMSAEGAMVAELTNRLLQYAKGA